MLAPVMVRTFGRTGSTLLMQILGSNERVCFERSYPFEHRYLTYAYNLARVVGEPCRTDEIWNNDRLFQSNSPVVGGLPYGEVELFDRELLARELFASNWERFSAVIRRRQGLRADVPAFYAEKVPRQVAAAGAEILGGRSIWLLRDPRDEMVSIKAFNAKRGHLGFGWGENDTDETYARRLCRNRRAFLVRLAEMRTDEREIGVRYEDLVQDGRREIERLSDWLGLPLRGPSAFRDRKIRKLHMTAPDAASTVERWRGELDADVQGIFAEELGDELRRLGYAA